MAITFDEAKRRTTLADRGLDFAGAGQVFDGPTATLQDTRIVYPEPRFVTAGMLSGRLVVVVWTPVGADRRVISMRYAHAKERRFWQGRLD